MQPGLKQMFTYREKHSAQIRLVTTDFSITRMTKIEPTALLRISDGTDVMYSRTKVSNALCTTLLRERFVAI
jgi:hypothetical protein